MNQDRIEVERGLSKSRNIFIQDLSTIMDLCCKVNRSNQDIQNLNEMFSNARLLASSKLIELGGPYLWKYRTEIKERNVKFFLENSFSEDLDSVEARKFNGAKEMLSGVKLTWQLLSEEQKEMIFCKINSMLGQYAKILLLEKKLNV